MNKELLDFMTWVNQDKKLGYTSIGIERIVNRYIAPKERYNQIIDEVYENYTQTKIIKTDGGETHISPIGHYNGMTKEQFINKCKTNPEFSETWGLKIEERELSEKERIIFAGYDYENGGGIGWNMIRETVDMDNSIPRKLITLTYNNETIESYE